MRLLTWELCKKKPLPNFPRNCITSKMLPSLRDLRLLQAPTMQETSKSYTLSQGSVGLKTKE